MGLGVRASRQLGENWENRRREHKLCVAYGEFRYGKYPRCLKQISVSNIIEVRLRLGDHTNFVQTLPILHTAIQLLVKKCNFNSKVAGSKAVYIFSLQKTDYAEYVSIDHNVQSRTKCVPLLIL